MSDPCYRVAVRTLCEFAAKQGDLDLRFTPSPTSQQGIAGHQAVAARRGPAYRAELPLSGEYRQLSVRGRADGYDPELLLLEEIKTYRGDIDRVPDNHRQLHWAQAKVYGHLLCQQLDLPSLTVALVYFDVGSQQEAAPLHQACSAQSLREFFEALCERFLAWADRELAHRSRRDAGLLALRFPHPAFRTGQRALAEAVFKVARAGRCLLAQAPTGLGKTIATLFPLLKACPAQAIDKVFFLSAKGSGQALALAALATITNAAPAPALRVITLVARDKACEHPDKACHGDACPLAKGFYDRLPAARSAAIDQASAGAALDRETLRSVALSHQVCPYYLGQELVRWCDVVVGDYNHYFDASALLYSLTLANAWRVGLLVDEAHNLIDRARAMYSAELDPAQLQAARANAAPALKKPLDRLHRSWRRLGKSQTEPYQAHAEPPAALAAALKDATAAMAEHLAAHPVDADPDVQRFFFEALQFGRLLESLARHSIFDATLPGLAPSRRQPSPVLCVRNVVPAPFLRPRFAAAHSAVLFSATLTPQHFYADTLGLPENLAWIDVESPFKPEQLSVHIVRDLSTRFAHRGESLLPIADLIADQYARRPGNYLAFFSSFDYLEQAAASFSARHPVVPTWQQGRRMDDAARQAFLARFEPEGCGIGFAVLGGSFAEAVDLAGTRLIGAFIATLGLPQFNPVNEALRQRLDADFGAGYDYTYLFPGIRKVVQAAGRVIRTVSDQGSVYLIDDRFARQDVLRLLPSWWKIERQSIRRLGLELPSPVELLVLEPTPPEG